MGNAPTKPRGPRAVRKYWSNATDRPSPPGKPALAPGSPNSQSDMVTIRWSPPDHNGGAPVTGYLVEHRRLGSPHWIRSSPHIVSEPELSLNGLEPGWKYQFRVLAENAAGFSEPGPVSDALIVTLSRNIASAPEFIKELVETVALENDSAEFQVQIKGTPLPKLCWYKDGFELFSSRRTKIVTEGDISTLVIYQAAFSDEGEIKCTATNRVGHVVTKARLRLEAPPRVRLPRQYEDGLLFEKDESIRLKVSVAGRPLPRCTWLHNGEPVPFGGRYEVVNTERATSLRIMEARRSDRGEYIIRATSRLGEDSASFLVTVTDRPMPPGKPKVAMTLGRSVTLTWAKPDDDGGCKIGNYIVEYYRIGWSVWLKAATCRQLSTTLVDLIEGSEYKFRVKAENPYGISEPSDESDVLFIPDAKRGLLDAPSKKLDDKGGNEESKRAKITPKSPERNINKESLDRRLKHLEATAEKRKPSDIHADTEIALKRAKEEILAQSTEQLEEVVMEAEDVEVTRLVIKVGNHLSPKEQKSEVIIEREKQRTPSPEKSYSPSVKRTPTIVLSSVNDNFQTSLYNDTSLPPSPLTPIITPLTPPASPKIRGRYSLHGSSELMLVLLPDSKDQNQTVQDHQVSSSRNQECNELEISIPPPMSLSAPELRGGAVYEPLPPLRNAVSSTELLHERAMARFYQAVAEQEAEEARNRKRRSFSLPDRRSSVQTSKDEWIPEKKEEETRPESPIENYKTDAEEDEEFENLRARLHSTSEDLLEDEEDEDNYLDDAYALSQEPTQSIKSERFYEEEDTYHPRSMVPRVIIATELPKSEFLPDRLKEPISPPPDFQPKPILKTRSKFETPTAEISRYVPKEITLHRRKSDTPTINAFDLSLRQKQEISDTQKDVEVGLSAGMVAQNRRLAKTSHPPPSTAEPEDLRGAVARYGDLIREYSGGGKKYNTLLYLDREEMKAASLSSDTLDDLSSIGSPQTFSPEPPKTYSPVPQISSFSESFKETKEKTKIIQESENVPKKKRDRSISKERSKIRERSQSKERPKTTQFEKNNAEKSTKKSSSRSTSRDRQNKAPESRSTSQERKTASKTKTSGSRSASRDRQNKSLDLRSESKERQDKPRTRGESRDRQSKKIRNESKDRGRVSLRDKEIHRDLSSDRRKVKTIAMNNSNSTSQKIPNADENVRGTMSYLADLSMFFLACWLYLCQDERLAVPVLLLMIYRQAREQITNFFKR